MTLQRESDLVPYERGTVPSARRVLIVAPHPDDEVFGCGGIGRLHVLQGVQVDVLVATDGNGAGDPTVRQAESREACALLGYSPPRFLGEVDGTLGRDPCAIDRVSQALVARWRHQPYDWIYAPSPWEIHPDHRACAVAVGRAVMALRNASEPPRWAAYEVGAPLWPNRLIDISRVWPDKQAAMACYPSQAAFQDYVGHIGALNRYRTYTLGPGCEAAEALWIPTQRQVLRVLDDWVDGHRHPRQAWLGASD